MGLESDGNKKKKKDLGWKSMMQVMKYSIEGLVYFYRYERSALVHLICAVLGILGAWMLHMSPMEWLVIIVLLVSILSTELINTAIEAVCDLVSPEYHPLVKVAKDCGSAATFVLY